MLITESAYGDRLHDSIAKMDADLASVITRTYERGAKVIMPSFARERAQELVLAIRKLKKKGGLPAKLPVFVDSPLTVKITDVFKLHPECYDAETHKFLRGRESPLDFNDLQCVESLEESKEVSASGAPCVIIAASGMRKAGRILQHLRATVEDARNTILIVGYQAQHTIG